MSCRLARSLCSQLSRARCLQLARSAPAVSDTPDHAHRIVSAFLHRPRPPALPDDESKQRIETPICIDGADSRAASRGMNALLGGHGYVRAGGGRVVGTHHCAPLRCCESISERWCRPCLLALVRATRPLSPAVTSLLCRESDCLVSTGHLSIILGEDSCTCGRRAMQGRGDLPNTKELVLGL
jgi:hypothetical protein